MFDTPVGLAVRRWCAPFSDWSRTPSPDDYLAARARLGAAESTRRLLRAALLSDVLVDIGLRGRTCARPAELAEAAGARGARRGSAGGRRGGRGPGRHERGLFRRRLRRAAPPGKLCGGGGEVDRGLPLRAGGAGAAAARRRGTPCRGRLARRGRADRANGGCATRCSSGTACGPESTSACPCRSTPASGTGTCACTAATRHCSPTSWPRSNRARCRLSCCTATPTTGRRPGWRRCSRTFTPISASPSTTSAPRRPAYLAECLELTPFAKLLFSTDAFALPELYCTGAALFRAALGRVLDSWVADGACAPADAERIASLVGGANARRVYRLDQR